MKTFFLFLTFCEPSFFVINSVPDSLKNVIKTVLIHSTIILAGGHIDATIADPSSYKSQIEAGEMNLLAVMSEERSTIYPDAPTFKELGYDMVIRAWATLVAPKDTPEEILTVLRDAASAAMARDDYKEYFANQGIDPQTLVGEECQTMMEEDYEMFGLLLENLELE